MSIRVECNGWSVERREDFTLYALFSTVTCASIVCAARGASVMAFTAALAVSMQVMLRQASGSMSGNFALAVDHGFHTTVVSELVLATTMRRRRMGSSSVTVAAVFR